MQIIFRETKLRLTRKKLLSLILWLDKITPYCKFKYWIIKTFQKTKMLDELTGSTIDIYV